MSQVKNWDRNAAEKLKWLRGQFSTWFHCFIVRRSSIKILILYWIRMQYSIGYLRALKGEKCAAKKFTEMFATMFVMQYQGILKL